MKLILIILSFSFTILTTAQKSKSCSKPKVEEIEINSISKCTLGNKKKKRSHRKKRKRGKKNKLKSNEVLFSIVDKAPLFPKCKKPKIKDKKSCFTKEFRKHFRKHFYSERVSENGVKGRVFIRFVVDIKGEIKKISVKGPKKMSLLRKEVKRVISKLPSLTPGKHKNFPVNVKYSLPMNFSK